MNNIKLNKKYALCFYCAAIFTCQENNKVICDSCGFEIEKELYDKIYNYAKTLVHYGYDCRKKYEEQFNEAGKITTVYCTPDPPTIQSFIGVAAISGIIGGISYDIVKKVIRKIIAKSKKIIDDFGQGQISIDEEDEIDIIIQYLKEYHLNEIRAPSIIQFHIKKEKFIDDLSDIAFTDRNNNQLDDEGVNKKREEILSELKKLVYSLPLKEKNGHNNSNQKYEKSKNRPIDEEEPVSDNFRDFWNDFME